jgi:hypothetical protein
MLTTTEEIQISESTTSFRITIDKVDCMKTLDECYEHRRNYESQPKQVLQQEIAKESFPLLKGDSA